VQILHLISEVSTSHIFLAVLVTWPHLHSQWWEVQFCNSVLSPGRPEDTDEKLQSLSVKSPLSFAHRTLMALKWPPPLL
jgi:hypothetical protein